MTRHQRRRMRSPASQAAGHGDGQQSLPHVPALEGLRGIAVLLVIVHHGWALQAVTLLDRVAYYCMAIGWSGVELFFVLSGYLITGILLDAKGGKCYFRNFYVRRVLRIFPLYYAVLVCYFVAAVVLPYQLAPPLENATGQQAWYLLYLSNFSMIAKGDFAPSSLGVTWSLAVEEQFYLVWPLVVWLLPNRWLLRLSIGLVLVSFAWRAGLTAAGANAATTYMMTPSQFGGIAAGAAVAALQRSGGGIPQILPWARRWLIVSLPLLVGVVGLSPGPNRMSWLNPMMNSVGMLIYQLFFASALVVVLAGKPLDRTIRLLTFRPLRACGRWSYGMYLLHMAVLPVIELLVWQWGSMLIASALLRQLLMTVVFVGASAAVGALSWNLYERRFLSLKRFFPMAGHRQVNLAGGRVLEPARATTPASQE